MPVTKREPAVDGAAGAWRDRPSAELVEHIVKTYHRPLRRELPALLSELEALMERSGGADENRELASAHDALRAIWSEVDNHIRTEEKVAFPWIVALERGEEVGEEPFSSLRHDHGFIYRALESLRVLTDGFSRLPVEAPEGPGLAERIGKLDKDLRRHQRLEEEILFPRAREKI
jgi:regulator of cell morphogenesis and NO signaling